MINNPRSPQVVGSIDQCSTVVKAVNFVSQLALLNSITWRGLENFKNTRMKLVPSSEMEMIGVVITFDDAENKAWLTVPESDLEQFIGHDASFQFSKTKDFKGKVTGVETDFLVVKFDETPLGLGQGSQVSVAE
jgi:hypothetical protein